MDTEERNVEINLQVAVTLLCLVLFFEGVKGEIN